MGNKLKIQKKMLMQKILKTQINKNLFKRTQMRAFSGF